jgi:hypothetical protein
MITPVLAVGYENGPAYLQAATSRNNAANCALSMRFSATAIMA